MEKITFRCERPETGYDGNINDVIEMSFEGEGLNIWDFANKVQKFALAIGYHPDSVKEVFNEE
jgi:hypothetical protein